MTLFQIFPQSDGWPFPRYIGACGRIVVEEDVGPPLLDFYSAPWEERVHFSSTSLQIKDNNLAITLIGVHNVSHIRDENVLPLNDFVLHILLLICKLIIHHP